MSLGILLMGLFVGFLVGLTGVGGAALLTPFLILIGINPLLAVGTDFFYNSITKFFGSVQHFRQKTINFTLVKYLAIGSVPSAIVALMMLQMIGDTEYLQEVIIKHALGYVLIIVAVATIIKTLFGSTFKTSEYSLKPIKNKRTETIILGAVLGFIVGLTSVGSGSLFALAMILFYRLKTSELVGTDIAHAFILVTVSSFFHIGLGNVDFLLVANLLCGSIPGVLIGSTLSAKVPVKPLQTMIGVIILVSGLKLIN
ncbi:sulfite exporter TauE/SafE family protein [Ferdinandcohnia quinoae]|uniref:Probable membrane transporter protein n=1 Tax=Fredinandcohnia quinoae TaxID=2918902 RepID=A0AAW5DXY1_9BACI|nr:sulfite exporter TauE/SafE family protein [Fredinandcohnia sp. SECRCQ15]MCH1625516.1 sulfite exporter TauE/SafE family protein [Fredinandcohnia sp. SECRCQ15]